MSSPVFQIEPLVTEGQALLSVMVEHDLVASRKCARLEAALLVVNGKIAELRDAQKRVRAKSKKLQGEIDKIDDRIQNANRELEIHKNLGWFTRAINKGIRGQIEMKIVREGRERESQKEGLQNVSAEERRLSAEIDRATKTKQRIQREASKNRSLMGRNEKIMMLARYNLLEMQMLARMGITEVNGVELKPISKDADIAARVSAFNASVGSLRTGFYPRLAETWIALPQNKESAVPMLESDVSGIEYSDNIIQLPKAVEAAIDEVDNIKEASPAASVKVATA